MKLFQSAVCLSSIALLLSACSDSNSSSSGSSTSDPNPIDKIEVGACESIENKILSAQVIEATDSLVLFAFGIANAPEDLEALQNRTEKAKTIFKTALESYPNSCDAQLGLAAAQMVNVISDKDVSTIYKAFANGDDEQIFSLFNIRNNFAGTAITAAVKTQDIDDKLITDRVQEIIANTALPSIDSAIYLLNNIRQTKDYTFSYETEDLEIYLGQGELALSVGTLNALKAFLTVVASYDLDASLDKSYDWLTSSLNWESFFYEGSELTDEDKEALEHAISLFETNSTFLSVKDSWKSSYKAVPDLLDSAIENIKDSYAYLLEQAKSGKTSSLSPFVGDGEESDLHADEIEQTLNILDSVQTALHGTITVSIDGEDVQINVRKFFELTDGFQQYLPYHTVNPIDTWKEAQTDSKYDSWISADEYDADFYTLYAENALFEKAKETLDTSIVDGDFGNDLSEMYFTVDENNFWYASVHWNGCQYAIQKGFDINEELSWFSLDSSVCKTESGTTSFKATQSDILPNPLNFTDKDGKVTLSFSDFNLKALTLAKNEAEKDEFVSLIESTVIFPDPTFHGVFPDMDQHKISVLLANLR